MEDENKISRETRELGIKIGELIDKHNYENISILSALSSILVYECHFLEINKNDFLMGIEKIYEKAKSLYGKTKDI